MQPAAGRHRCRRARRRRAAIRRWPRSGDLPHAVFDGTPSNPTEAAVRAAVAVYAAERCDGLIAVGGGSQHRPGQGRGDCRHARRAAEDLRHHRRRQPADQRTRGAADRRADHRRHRQRSGARRHRHRRRRPQAGLPQLAPDAQGRPARPRADAGPAAGADRRHRHGRDRALHGDLHGAGVNPPADGIALDGLARGWAHIERATRNGQRPRRALADDERQHAGRDGVPEGPGLRAFAVSHSLGGVNPRLHHGTLNAMFLPAVVRFNAAAESIRRERRLQRMAQAMGLPAATSRATTSPRPSAR